MDPRVWSLPWLDRLYDTLHANSQENNGQQYRAGGVLCFPTPHKPGPNQNPMEHQRQRATSETAGGFRCTCWSMFWRCLCLITVTVYRQHSVWVCGRLFEFAEEVSILVRLKFVHWCVGWIVIVQPSRTMSLEILLVYSSVTISDPIIVSPIHWSSVGETCSTYPLVRSSHVWPLGE